MITGPTPPALYAKPVEEYAAQIGFPDHYDVCVSLRAGQAKVAVSGMPNYEVYYASPDIDVLAREEKGEITVESPSLGIHSYSPAKTVCLFIARK